MAERDGGTVRIALLIEQIDGAQQAVVTGFRRYRDRHRLPWEVRQVTPGEIAQVPSGTWWVTRGGGYLEMLPEEGPQWPVCSLVGTPGPRHRVCCRFEDADFGRLAAQHLSERGYRHVVTVDTSLRPRLRERLAGFRGQCREQGLSYEHLQRQRGGDAGQSDARLVDQFRDRIAPVGVYALTDGQAVWLLDLLLAHGLRVPEEVAIIGTGDHTSACVRREPELSSVAFPWGLMGEAAARHLHQQIHAGTVPEATWLRPYHVVARASTHPRKPRDPLVQRARRWLARHLGCATPARSVAAALGLAEVTLGRRFRADLGVGPKQEHDRLRIERACELLGKPHLTIADIAGQCGFASPTAFGVAFKRRRGCSPRAWRAALGR